MQHWGDAPMLGLNALGSAPLPARSALGCNGLALGARVETECIAAA